MKIIINAWLLGLIMIGVALLAGLTGMLTMLHFANKRFKEYEEFIAEL